MLPANLENITTIMLQNIDQNKIEAKKKVDASLRRLEEQKLIIKNGDQFIFLTNEEQDINREIREIKIDTSEIIEKVGDDIFSALFGLNKKYRYNDRYDFSFNTAVTIETRDVGPHDEQHGPQAPHHIAQIDEEPVPQDVSDTDQAARPGHREQVVTRE